MNYSIVHHESVTHKWTGLTDSRLRHEIIRRMINYVVSDLIKTSENMIDEIKPSDIEQVRECGKSLIKMSDATESMHKALKKYLRVNLYQHERVMSMANKAKETVSFLFNAYMEDSDLLTNELQSSLNEAKDFENKNVVARVVADYIAGMTDRFAFSEADRIRNIV